VRRQLVAIISATFLLLRWIAYDGTAASIADPLLNPLRDYLVKAAARCLSRTINGNIEVGTLRGGVLFSAGTAAGRRAGCRVSCRGPHRRDPYVI
jgi:hypothetical protein